MEAYTNEYDTIRKIFYSSNSKFKNFRNIDKNVIEKIDKLIKIYQEKIMVTSVFTIHNSRTNEYTNLLKYLLSDNKLSFDEKILFVIRYFDPELKALYLFLDSDCMEAKDLQSEDNDFIISSFKEINTEFASDCRNLIGIYDSFLIQYELLFFKYYRAEELKFNIRKDYTKKFFRLYPVSRLYLNISDEELDRIIKSAHDYKNKYGIPRFNDLMFQLLEQPSLLDITGNSVKELFVFMIYVIDEEFKALRLYDEYCNWSQINTQCFKTLGFSNQDFVTSEIKFAEDNPKVLNNIPLF